MAAQAVAKTDMVHGANIALHNSFDKSQSRVYEDDIPSFMRQDRAAGQEMGFRKKGVLDRDDQF